MLMLPITVINLMEEKQQVAKNSTTMLLQLLIKKFPFGTKLKVTNEANNKSVIVEVIDRGPFVKAERSISVKEHLCILLLIKKAA